MSHLTLDGKRCKVGEKRALCIFHRRKSSSGSTKTRGRRRISSGGKRRSSDPVPWYIAMSGPQKRKLRAALRAEELAQQLNFIPKWAGVRSGERTGRYGLPRNQYRSRTRTGTRGRRKYASRELMRDFNSWIDEMSRSGGFLDTVR